MSLVERRWVPADAGTMCSSIKLNNARFLHPLPKRNPTLLESRVPDRRRTVNHNLTLSRHLLARVISARRSLPRHQLHDISRAGLGNDVNATNRLRE